MNATTTGPAEILRRTSALLDAVDAAGRLHDKYGLAECDWCGGAGFTSYPYDNQPLGADCLHKINGPTLNGWAYACGACRERAARFADLCHNGIEAAYPEIAAAGLLEDASNGATFKDAKAARGYLKDAAKNVPGPRRRKAKAPAARKSARVLARDWQRIASAALEVLGYQPPADADTAARTLEQLSSDPIADVLEAGARAMAERGAAV